MKKGREVEKMSSNSTLNLDKSGGKNWFKYIIIGLLFLGWILGGIDRTIINFAAVTISKEFTLTSAQTGLMMSAFFAGYLLMQLPGGFLADKFGPRKVLLTIVLVWSVFTGLTALAWSFSSLLGIRFLFGLAEGSFFGAANKMIALTVPREERGRAISLVLVSSGVVNVIAPIFAAKMIVATGWRPMFLIVAAAGIVIAGLYFYFLKPTARAGEELTQTVQANENKKKVTFKQMLKVPMMWNAWVANFGVYTIIWGLSAWMPSYLVKVMHVNMMSAGWLQSIPGVGTLVGLLCSGFIIDKMTPGRNKLVVSIGSLLLIGLIFLMYKSVDVSTIIAYQTIISIITGYIVIYYASVVLKTMPSSVVGSAAGFMNFGGQCGSFFAPVVMGIIADAFNGAIGQSFWYLFALSIVLTIATITVQTNVEKHITAE